MYTHTNMCYHIIGVGRLARLVEGVPGTCVRHSIYIYIYNTYIYTYTQI